MTEYFIQLAQLAGIFLVIGVIVVFLCWLADKVI
jgi:hypothetical protein